jgi:hypothetical protein
MSNGDGIIRSLVGGDLEGFRQRFESFLDSCPSFLYHVGTGRFLPVFFFSMFATAHDAGILDPSEKVYFRFDNHGIDTGGRNRNTGNLKVAVLTNKFHGKKRIVRQIIFLLSSYIKHFQQTQAWTKSNFTRSW